MAEDAPFRRAFEAARDPLTARNALGLNAGFITDAVAAAIAALGGIPGTDTNDNAPAGYVGEYIEAIRPAGTALNLTSTTAVEVASILLTPGDWDVRAIGYFKFTGATYTRLISCIATASATLDVTPGRFNEWTGSAQSPGNDEAGLAIPAYRFSLGSNTIIYLNNRATFSAGSIEAYGILSARRMR